MALVVSVFESADYRGGSPDHLCELLLGEACALSKRINLARDRVVSLGFRELGHPLWMYLIVPPMNDLDGIAGQLALLFEHSLIS